MPISNDNPLICLRYSWRFASFCFKRFLGDGSATKLFVKRPLKDLFYLDIMRLGVDSKIAIVKPPSPS